MTALIITYYWPPSSGSGVQRWMYFAKYLEEFGVKPVVLTVRSEKASYRYLDETLNLAVAHVETHRTNTREPLKLYSFLMSGSSRKAIPHGHIGAKKGLLDRLGNLIRSNFFVPDARIGWNRFALREARRIIGSQPIDIVITTGTPHSTHLIGRQLKKEFGLKWIADFRDPWSELYYNKELVRLPFAWRKDRRLELQVLQQSDAVIAAGPSLSRLLAAKVSESDRTKFHHILNGYDAELMAGLKPEPSNQFTMTFIGLLTVHQPFGSILNAMRVMIDKPNFIQRARLVLAGTVDDEVIDQCKRVKGLDVKYLGRVTHKESLQLMMNSPLLLNCLPETEEARLFVTGKLMEYLATGNPILCVGPLDGDAAALLNETTNSRMFSKDDPAGMAEFMELVFDKWTSGEGFRNRNLERVRRFSRRETTGELVRVINAM